MGWGKQRTVSQVGPKRKAAGRIAAPSRPRRRCACSTACSGTTACPRAAPAGLRVQGLGFRVQGLGFRVQGLGFRVLGLGFRRFKRPGRRRAACAAGRSKAPGRPGRVLGGFEAGLRRV